MSSLSATSSNQIDNKEEPFMNNNQNILQKHAAFFDRNKDGVIYPWETFQGCRAIGLGLGVSTALAVFVNLALSGSTRPGKFPNLLFPIEVQNIVKSKHTSNTGVYDAEGNFDSAKFEEIFQKHSKANANALTADELSGMLKSNRVPKDYKGLVASWVEWKTFFSFCKDKNGLLQKETLRAFYAGDLFEQMEQERTRK
ncbi:hypothetical protein C5167_017918 [Papaver somniferum]|uniref:EF-hand domain-containing protein n=1 Tax=Papaver somniferum TaxID=3469 RepID=A0A4Y7IKS5_PAPSO|nr:probable peroxygenase 5 [Papaver somniferum]RZC49493.1 hypothetical protein C5167_017918 [Papaver somniferum]